MRSDDTDTATASPSTLTFTTSTYNTAQTVTVTGVANGSASIDHAFRLTGATAAAIPDAGTVTVSVGDPIKRPTALTIVPGPDRLYLSWTAPTDTNRTGWSPNLSYQVALAATGASNAASTAATKQERPVATCLRSTAVNFP